MTDEKSSPPAPADIPLPATPQPVHSFRRPSSTSHTAGHNSSLPTVDLDSNYDKDINISRIHGGLLAALPHLHAPSTSGSQPRSRRTDTSSSRGTRQDSESMGPRMGLRELIDSLETSSGNSRVTRSSSRVGSSRNRSGSSSDHNEPDRGRSPSFSHLSRNSSSHSSSYFPRNNPSVNSFQQNLREVEPPTTIHEGVSIKNADLESAAHSSHHNRLSTGVSWLVPSADTRHHAKDHLHWATRHRAANQDPNQPYIPSTSERASQSTSLQTRYFSSTHDISESSKVPLNPIAALIATTNSLASVASPICSTIAPKWNYRDGAGMKSLADWNGDEKQGPHGKVSRYSLPGGHIQNNGRTSRSKSRERKKLNTEEADNIVRTEGAAPEAFEGEYDDAEDITRVPSPTYGDDDYDVEAQNFEDISGNKRGERRQQEIFILHNRCSPTEARDFLVRLANALMIFGAPTHRIESVMESAARVLDCDAHFLYLPGNMILCFNDPQFSTSETAFLRAVGSLDVEKLTDVHRVVRQVMHDVISASEGSLDLAEITSRNNKQPWWMRILVLGFCSFFASSLAFKGSLVDMCMSFWLGCMMGACQLLAQKNPLLLNGFEIAMAFLTSFCAKALSASGIFCYQSLASAAIVMILPGYVICTGALEVACRSVIPGSIRLMYGIALSVFLGIGISLGSALFNSMDPAAAASSETSTTLSGTFNSTDRSISNPFTSGTFTFMNTTDSAVSGTVLCPRSATDPWWNSAISPWWLFIITPGFALALMMWTNAKLRSKDAIASMTISCVSYALYYVSSLYITDHPEVLAAIAACAVGLMGNLYSRIARGTAYTAQTAAMLLIVPNSLAAAGGLAISSTSGSSVTSFEVGTEISLRQLQVALGITMGMFVASTLTYSGAKKRGAYFTY